MYNDPGLLQTLSLLIYVPLFVHVLSVTVSESTIVSNVRRLTVPAVNTVAVDSSATGPVEASSCKVPLVILILFK